MKSDRALCREAGKHDNYLSEVKYRNPEQYGWMKRHGIVAYEERSRELRDWLANLYYEKNIASVWRRYAKDLYRTEAGFRSTVMAIAFSTSDKALRFNAFKKLNAIKERIDETSSNEPGK